MARRSEHLSDEDLEAAGELAMEAAEHGALDVFGLDPPLIREWATKLSTTRVARLNPPPVGISIGIVLGVLAERQRMARAL